LHSKPPVPLIVTQTASPVRTGKPGHDAVERVCQDKLEDRLHALVCAGKLPIEQAQREIATDWIAAYERYLGEP